MKKIFTIALFMLSFVVAQATTLNYLNFDRGNEERLKVQAIEQTRQLAVKIGLNEADYIRVRQIVYQKLAATQEIDESYANNPEQRKKKLQAIEEEYNQQLAGALSAKQHKIYLALASAN